MSHGLKKVLSLVASVKREALQLAARHPNGYVRGEKEALAFALSELQKRAMKIAPHAHSELPWVHVAENEYELNFMNNGQVYLLTVEVGSDPAVELRYGNVKISFPEGKGTPASELFDMAEAVFASVKGTALPEGVLGTTQALANIKEWTAFAENVYSYLEIEAAEVQFCVFGKMSPVFEAMADANAQMKEARKSAAWVACPRGSMVWEISLEVR